MGNLVFIFNRIKTTTIYRAEKFALNMENANAFAQGKYRTFGREMKK
jgi:hypothetical protein